MRETALVLGVDSTEDLARFPFHLLFFAAADVGHDVVENIERGYTWVAGARDGLEGSDVNGVDGTEGVFESFEWNDKTGRRAIGVGDDVALL